MTRIITGSLVVGLLGAVIAEVSGPAVAQAPTAPPFKTRGVDASFESGSPDGRLVLYRPDQTTGRLYVRELATNRDRVLIDLDGQTGRFIWSPDSTHVAFTITTGAPPRAEIRIIAIGTGAVRTLDASGSVMAWTTSNDIFFRAPSQTGATALFRVPALGGTPTIVLWGGFQGSPVAVTPDGSSVVLRYAQRLVLHNLTTHFERTITAVVADERLLVVSPDGRLVAFASNQGGEYALYVAPLDRPSPQPGGAIRIASLEGFPSQFAGWWTTDGLLAVANVTYAEANIFRIDMNAATGHALGPARRLTQGAFDRDDPIVSADGGHVGYWFGIGTAEGVAAVDSTGGSERVLFERPRSGIFYPFAWPSQNEVLIYDVRAVGALNPVTRAIERIPQSELTSADRMPLLAGDNIVYISGASTAQGNQLKVRPLSGGAARAIATVDYLRTIAVSADGRHIAYVANVSLAPDAATEMRLMTIDGVFETVLLPRTPGSFVLGSFSPDGRYLLYFDDEHTARMLNVATLESWPLLTSDADRQIDWSDHAGQWSPNGSFIAQVGHELRRVPVARAWEGVTADAVSRLLAAREGR